MFEEVHLDSWDSLIKCYNELDNPQYDWIFRGHREACWGLESTLERCLVARFGIPFSDLRSIEKSLIRSFQRGAHIYIADPPAQDDTLEWMSLMQHFGAPTRLLDWTYSFYVAVFFAVENAFPDKPCAIWAINQLWLIENAKL